ncbi:MAG: YdiU family protein [Salinarimonas sp.]|nr:YdiU family protein [Salinarimonas sp.]
MPSTSPDSAAADTVTGPLATTTGGFAFDNSYARLPERFYARMPPEPVAAPRLIRFNHALAAELGLDAAALDSPEGAEIFAGNRMPQGAEPLAMAYAGHQFGHYTPQLGDGRAILLGEVIDRAGQRRDIQLKGSGRTPFSRQGDGRAALGPVLREYVMSEAMHALGVPTTRALAAVTTGEQVVRDAFLPGGIVTRVASSHIRVGTFQYFAAHGDHEAVATLADHVIARHFPEIGGMPDRYLALYEQVLERQAALVAHWMSLGFIHGVMNTDNMAISGETIDYGPCAFMDAYDPATKFSFVDEYGRYAYVNQPRIAPWNLARLAEALLPHVDADTERGIARLGEILGTFPERYRLHWRAHMRAKIGLDREEDGDDALIEDLLDAMHQGGADFTLTFRNLADAVLDDGADEAIRDLFTLGDAIRAWLPRWRARLAHEARPPGDTATAMRGVNPFVIPRNHRVEAMIDAAVTHDDFGPFDTLNDVLAEPFADKPQHAAFQAPPLAHERVTLTFCGT